MLKKLVRVLRLYGKLQLLQVRIYLAYRADFWIGIVGMALTQGAGLFFIWTIFQRVPEIGGWNVWEIAMLYSLVLIPTGLTELLYNGQWKLRVLVNKGEFDRFLVRPLSPVLQVITQECGIHGIGSVVLGILILTNAIRALNLSWNWWHYVFLFLTLASAVMLIGAVNLATNCIGFWEASANSAFPFMVQHNMEFSKYPLTVYDQLIQIFITWILPFAFVSYYPGLVLLNKSSGYLWLAYFSPLIGPIMTIVASIIWRQGLRRYQGTGH